MVLNDQGGAQMGISYDVTSTLRAEDHQHPPLVMHKTEEAIPINTMVATRETPEMRTTFGVGEPGDPQFTISAAHSHAVFVEDKPTYSLDEKMGQTYVWEEQANTLAQRDYKQPQAVFSAGFSFGQSAKARSLGYQEEISPTIRGGEGGNQKPCVVTAVPIENHPNDSRAKLCEDGVVQTLSGRMGTGGNNTPLVMERRFSDIRVSDTDISPTIEAGVGDGGNNLPMVMESVLPFDTTQITSPNNWSTPKPGDPCHPLASTAHPPTIAFTQNQREEVRDLEDVATAVQAESGTHQQTYVTQCIGNGQADIASHISEEVAQTLSCMHDQLAIHTYGVDAYNQTQYDEVSQTLREPVGGDNTAKVMTTYGLDRASYNQGKNAQFDFSVEEESAPTQVSRGPGAVCAAVDCRNGTENSDVNGTLQSKEQGYNHNQNNVCRTNNVVRRLTPMECERLQSFPDFWTNIGDWVDSKGKLHKGDADSPRYKALGNSIALPFWDWLLGRISAQYDRPATLGSLFDGIGGFPLCWEKHNGKGTALWASEIEEFPIAVTKLRFPENDDDLEKQLAAYKKGVTDAIKEIEKNEATDL